MKYNPRFGVTYAIGDWVTTFSGYEGTVVERFKPDRRTAISVVIRNDTNGTSLVCPEHYIKKAVSKHEHKK